jgi:dTDP-4-amino-4,6-dideoxygalactose transaminase
MRSVTTAVSVPFHVPSIRQEEIRAVVEALESGWITTGPKTHQFEQQFARYIGASHAIAVNSCTAALHLSLEAAGIGEGDEILVPTLTFTATAEVAMYLHARPVLVDVDPLHFNLNPSDVERMVTSRTRAIVPVHFAGHPCDMDSLLEIACAKGLTIVEDAAHAIPAKYRGKTIGTIGSLTAFSFYATKTLTTGEGGMVTTDDDAFAERIKLMRLHGMSRDAWKRYSAEGTWRYDILEAGYKYNMTDPQAALGLVQLAKCDEMRRKRAEIARRYDLALGPLDAYRSLEPAPNIEHAWHLYIILVDPSVLRIHRDQVIEELHDRGIGTAVHFIPLHLQSYYQHKFGYRAGQFPVAEDYFERCISLPIYPDMTTIDVDRVIEALQDIATEFRR